VGGIEPRSGPGEGSRCEGSESQQVDVERLKRKPFTVEGIDPEKFDTLATKNFSNWEDVSVDEPGPLPFWVDPVFKSALPLSEQSRSGCLTSGLQDALKGALG